MASAKQLAAKYINDAKRDPNAAPDILRKAAYTFMGLAQDPKNAHVARELANIGLDFAGASTQPSPATMDDFTDLLQETAIAYNETGNEMDLIARRRETHDARTPKTPGAMSIAPESFNRDATLGRSAVIKFDPTNDEKVQGIQQSQNVAFWQGVKKEAQAMTVDVSLGFLPTLAVLQGETFSLTNVRPFAEIEFGSDGNRTKVKCDISFGNRFTVVGNYIAVTVGMAPPMVGSVATQITAGASIGTFAAPSQAPIFLTEYIDFLTPVFPNNRTELIPIPLKAVQLFPVQTNLDLNEKLLIEFFDYGSALIAKVFYRQSDVAAMQPIPITGDVAFVRVTNDPTNINALTARLPFQLGM